MKYHVQFYYLATGMEGMASEDDYGWIEARSEDDAINTVAEREMPDSNSRDFFKSCLYVSEAKEP